MIKGIGGSMRKVYASSVAVLDSNVALGGGTDVTDELQAVLDLAKTEGGIHLVLDGAALVRGLVLHSNTVIECPNKDCGLYLVDYTDRPLLRNAEWSFKKRNTRNISIIGGTYNHNCAHQRHHVSPEEFGWPDDFTPTEGIEEASIHFVCLFEFYGVENFTVRDVIFRDQRSYTLTLGNFKNALIENSAIEMVTHIWPSNQDGFHFFGPGQLLTMKNVRGKTGDDFINVAPDELDGVSSITDVLIDGVVFEDTCQGIRMLSKKDGRLDRVTVKNVTGTYRTFGFSIIPFYPGDNFSNVGDLYFENINLKQIPATYHYTPLTMMQFGGNIECVTMKNVRFHTPVRNNVLFDIGRPFHYAPPELTQEEIELYQLGDSGDEYVMDWMPEKARPHMGTFIIDGLTVINDSNADNTNIVELRYKIDNFIAKNVQVFRSEDAKTSGNLIKLCNEAEIKNLIVEDVFAEKLETVVSGNDDNSVEVLKVKNVVLKEGTAVVAEHNVHADKKIISDIESGLIRI